MPILCTDLGIFQFCISGNNKASIKKKYRFFCFQIVCKKQYVSDHYFLTYETLSHLFKINFRFSSSMKAI